MLHTLLVAALALAADTAPAPVTDTLHGRTITDEWRWLEGLEKDSPAVAQWTTSQIDRTRSTLESLPCRAKIAATLEPLLKLPSVGMPSMHGDWCFFGERTGDQNQAVLKVQKGTDPALRARAITLIDPNAMDANGLISLDWNAPSDDGTLIAYGTSRAGSEMSELHVMEVGGAPLTDTITGKVSFQGWTPTNDGFLYSALRDPKDPYSREVRFHVMGSDPATDRLILKQTNPSEIPFAGLSRDGRWMMLGFSRGWQANDLSVADFPAWRKGSGDPQAIEIARGLPARFTPIGFEGDRMLMMTTLDAPRSRLVAVDLKRPARTDWKDVIPEPRDEVLESVGLTKGGMVAAFTKHVCTRLERFDRSGRSLGEIPLPGLGAATYSVDEDRTDAFVSYTSYNEPRSVYFVPSLADPKPASWWKPTVPIDLSKWMVERVRVASKDGTLVPLFMVRRSDLTPNGDRPCLLYGYGGFNVSLEPGFNPSIAAWVEAGGVYAVANLRGGGEYGEAWHEAGMLDRKQNVFDDFYACAEWLIGNRWTSPSRLAIQGGSNGGLLTGVAVTQRPDLFAAAISAVPLLDMLRYHQFLLAKYWVPEYGSADDAKQFEWLLAYSPYHNLKPGTKYPAVLFTAGENDSRVHPLHARKMAARMQALNADQAGAKPILLWVDRDAGHGQGKPLAARIRDQVDQWSFLMWQTGLCGPAK
ncbi:MAG: S9 family peptidase [Planctomycetes bacterium]|nr:S9 family peptidase [Planctomycetota bacterium]